MDQKNTVSSKVNRDDMGPFRKIVWAVEVFASDEELERKARQILEALTKNMDTEILPTTVTGPASLVAGREDMIATLQARFSALKMKGLLPIQVVDHEVSVVSAIRGQVLSLIDFAKRWQANLIAVHTTAKTGISRMLLGSFAETLVLNSDVPVLSINPTTIKPGPIEKIFFATDFSHESESVFPKVIQLCQMLKAKLILFHKVTNPSGAYIGPYGGLRHDLRSLDEENLARIKSQMAEWSDKASQLQLDVESFIDPEQTNRAEAIIRAADKKGANILAMVSRSGPIAAAVLGSTCRQVLRQAHQPVWIIHP